MKIVYLNTINKVKNFIRDCEDFTEDINACQNHFMVDAKSQLGLFVFDLSKPITVEIISNDNAEIERFEDLMRKYA